MLVPEPDRSRGREDSSAGDESMIVMIVMIPRSWQVGMPKGKSHHEARNAAAALRSESVAGG